MILSYFMRIKYLMGKLVKRVFNFNPQHVSKHLKPFKHIVKSRHGLQSLVKGSKKLTKVIEKVFNKKTLMAAGVTSAVAIGVSHIWDYIESNSGCFLKRPDQTICKVQELSCCQPGKLDNVSFCDGFANSLVHTCNNYDVEKEPSCCRLCSCQHLNCLPNETAQCQRPSVADALTHFAGNVTSGITSGITSLFPWLPYVIYVLGAIFILWILSFLKPFIYRKKRQDV